MSSVRIEPNTEGGLSKVFIDETEVQGVKKFKLSQGEGESATLELEVAADSANAVAEQVGVEVNTKEKGGQGGGKR